MLCRFLMSMRYFLLVYALHNYKNVDKLLTQVSGFLSASGKTRELLNSSAVSSWVRYHCQELAYDYDTRSKVVVNVQLLYREWEKATNVAEKQKNLLALVEYVQYVKYKGNRDFLFELVAYTRFLI